MGALPLNTMSRIWGKFNEMEIPVWMREPGFKLYGWIFGCNFDEIREKDLKKFRNLAEFFYREIDPARRPIAAAPIVGFAGPCGFALILAGLAGRWKGPPPGYC